MIFGQVKITVGLLSTSAQTASEIHFNNLDNLEINSMTVYDFEAMINLGHCCAKGFDWQVLV